MKIIDPSVSLLGQTYALGDLNDESPMKLLELCIRNCYKSEDKITDDSWKSIIKLVLDNGHTSTLEHVSFTFRIITSRDVLQEIARHRIASYSCECLSADTVIHPKGYTIKQLYERFNYPKTCYDKTHNKTIRLKSCDEKNNVIFNKVLDVLYKGKNVVYEVTTELGYKIKATMNHEFMTQDQQFKKLCDLKIGDHIMVNGRPCLLSISDEQLINCYETMTPLEISEFYGCPYRSVIERLKRMGIFQKHKNDKNLEKYNKNHTADSYAKMRNTIKKQYKNGRVVWNKMLDESTESVKRQADALRKYHWNSKPGKENPNWKSGIGGYYRKLTSHIHECQICGSTQDLETHHLDGNRYNNEPENLIKVCTKCHKKFHYHTSNIVKFKGTTCIRNKITNIKYIGEEDTYDIVMKSPYNNFIANGFVVHNSTRYCNYGDSKKGITFVKPQWITWEQIEKANNLLQSRDESSVLYELNNPDIDKDIKCVCNWIEDIKRAEFSYNMKLDLGWKPQQARVSLPGCLKTEIISTMNIRSLLNFLQLRTSPQAHPDMQVVAKLMQQILQEKWPLIFGSPLLSTEE